MIKLRQPFPSDVQLRSGACALLGALALVIGHPAQAQDVSGVPAAAAVSGQAPMPMAASGPATAAPLAGPATATSAVSASTPSGAPAPAPVAPKVAEMPRVRVVYLNDSDRARILAELKQDVLQTAKDDNWAQPNTFPDWVSRIRFSGDIMFRGEADLYDHGNDNQIVNFQTFNNKGPTVYKGGTQLITLPFLNTTEDRYLPRLRVHIGMFAQVADNMEAIFRFATGNTTNPGTATTTLGSDFAKQNFLFDRAYMNYRPSSESAIALGRMGNPWSTPTDMIWSKELAFDGLAMQLHPQLSRSTALIATVGAFSVLNTDPNFPSSSVDKTGSHGDWLYGAQFGFDWTGASGTDARVTAAYYDFADIQGKLSSPCYAPSSAVVCDTDNSAPLFMQKGNTVMFVRDLQLVNAGDAQYQLVGLASKFRLLDLNGTLDTIWSGPVHLAFDADFVDNLAFSRSAVLANGPQNNFGSCSTNCVGAYAGGGRGEQAQVRVGFPKISEKGQWNVLLGYRDVQSDAVVDAFNDQDFHLGGTNAKGYFVGGSIGFTHNAWVSARWLSATEDSGPPLAIDVLQIDVNARF